MVISNNSNHFELGENEYIFGRKYCKFQRVFVGMKMVIREKTVLQERNMNFEFICIFFTHKKKKLIMALLKIKDFETMNLFFNLLHGRR